MGEASPCHCSRFPCRSNGRMPWHAACAAACGSVFGKWVAREQLRADETGGACMNRRKFIKSGLVTGATAAATGLAVAGRGARQAQGGHGPDPQRQCRQGPAGEEGPTTATWASRRAGTNGLPSPRASTTSQIRGQIWLSYRGLSPVSSHPQAPGFEGDGQRGAMMALTNALVATWLPRAIGW